MHFEILDKKSGKTLEVYDGVENVVLHVFKERGLDGYKIFVNDEMANMLVEFFNRSEKLNGHWINTRSDSSFGHLLCD